jgi:hypothetical protein
VELSACHFYLKKLAEAKIFIHLIFVREAITAYNYTILPMGRKIAIWQKPFFMVKHDLKQGLGPTL